MTKYIKKTALILTAIVGISGCASPDHPKYDRTNWGAIPAYLDNGEINSEPKYIIDEDRDGTADIIIQQKNALYVAPRYKVRMGLIVDENTKVLTKEQRDRATKVLKAEQELSDLLKK